MSTLSLPEAEDMNKMLEYLIQEDTFLGAEHFKEKILPEKSLSYINTLIEKMIDLYNKVVIEPTNQNFTEKLILANAPAEHFLETGGYVAMYNQALEAHQKAEASSEAEYKKMQLEIKALQNTLRDYKQTKKDTGNALLWAKIAALAAVAAVAATILLAIIK